MPNLYSEEVAIETVLPILRRALRQLEERLERLGGPAHLPPHGGWDLIQQSASSPDSEIGAEPSSSESEDEF